MKITFEGVKITFGSWKCKFLYVEMLLKALSVFFEVETKGRDGKEHEKPLKHRNIQKSAFTAPKSDFHSFKSDLNSQNL